MSRYELAAEAEADLDAIFQHIATVSGPRAAMRVMQEFRRAFRTLADAPRAGHARRDLTERPFLFWRTWSYLIAYNPEAEPLLIMRIIHGARDVGEILD